MSEKKLVWTNEKRKVNDLIPYEKNPRKLTEKQKEFLQKSLTKFNLMSIPTINTDNTIISGHQRVKILQLLGRGNEEIDVRVPNRKLTEAEMREANLLDNKTQELGEWDFDLLKDFDVNLLKDVGFSDTELGIPDVEFDEPPETVSKNLEELQNIKNQRKKSNEQTIEKTDTEKYLVIVFKNRSEKEKLLSRLNLPLDERYIPADSIEITIKRRDFFVSEKSAPLNKSGLGI